MASKKSPTNTALPGQGVDVGTANIASATFELKPNGDTVARCRKIRDCFLSFGPEEIGTLEIAGVNYSETSNGQLVVVGEDALRMSAALGLEVRRPLKAGFISDKEDLGKDVVRILLENVLGEPSEPDELAVFSVPGTPYGGDPTKAAFHTRFFSDRIRERGFKPLPINEAMAVGFDALGQAVGDGTKFTGLCFSFGAGMTNVALVYQGLCSKAFSIPFGGDFIDETAAKNTNTPVSSVTLLKEEGIDLLAAEETVAGGQPAFIIERRNYHDSTSDRQAEAITLVYVDLLEKLRDALNGFFNDPKNRVDIRETLPVVVAGGTTMAKGFLALFDRIVLQGLDVRLALAEHAITTATPLTSVAQGAVRYARTRTQAKRPLISVETEVAVGE